MRWGFLVLATVCALAAVSGEARGEPILDQSQTGYNNCVWGGGVYQQSVTAGTSGQLTQVDVILKGVGGSIPFGVRIGAPWQEDTPEFSTSLSGAGWVSVDVSGSGIFLTAGDVFTLQIGGTGDDQEAFAVNFLHDNYLAGALYQQSGLYGWDLAFRTYMDPSAGPGPVPEPTSLALFGLGVLGLGVVRRRRHRA